ncbi:hypothetical protein L1049_000924 [Liquidambar formosana]|uniref:Amino acid transporter transmembrane domain-containing protein n=1 Tax=Liquidambar formosana TaxID=63359 RepID=A0AAP0N9Y9_LIQFO
MLSYLMTLRRENIGPQFVLTLSEQIEAEISTSKVKWCGSPHKVTVIGEVGRICNWDKGLHTWVYRSFFRGFKDLSSLAVSEERGWAKEEEQIERQKYRLLRICNCDKGLYTGYTGNGRIKGSIRGVPATSTAHKLYLSFQALGDVAFAYPYSIILLEIQDTLKSPPPENKTMKKASMIAIFVTTFFYLCCGCFGYAAFGNSTPGNLLTGFGFYEPYWLIDFANACIVLHLVGGYQAYKA